MKNQTKRALLTSVLALVLCASMFVGTTFAWFTDSVTSANNKIASGNLDVELRLWNSAADYTNITEATAPVFGGADSLVAQNNNADTLWEPGKTQVAYFSIKNAGSLDLKYQVALVVTALSGADLSDVMEYAIIPGAIYGDVTAWDADAALTIENAPGINTQATDVALDSGDEHFFALAIHMNETAGNEYMNSSITFDIKVLATQLASETDAFDSTYDAGATYDPIGYAFKEAQIAAGASAVELELRESTTNKKVAAAVVPAAAIGNADKPVVVTITETVYTNSNIIVDDGQTSVAYDIKATNLKEGNTEPVKVSVNLPTGMDPATVKVYHYGEEIASSYNPTSGVVSFETASFSPFTFVYNAESEYEAPSTEGVATPKAVVTYAPEFVGDKKLAWGNYGQWSPTEGLTSDLEAAFVFACPENDTAAYDTWYCDFYVSLDQALGENQIFLGGNYGSFGWVGFHNGTVTLGANQEIGLLESVTTNPWTYADVKNFVGTFTCGVADVNDALEGATFTVKLRLTNPENEAEYYDVNVVTYTFGGNAVIDGATVATTAQDLQDAFQNGGNVVLGGDIDLNDLSDLFGGN